MKGIIGLLIGVVLLISFSSCQKEIDGTIQGKTTVDSTVLWKYIVMDTTLSPGLDTLEKYFYEYDSRNRISRITNYSRSDTSSSPVYRDSLISNFYYQGNDSVPYKTITAIKYGDGTSDDLTCFATFQNNKLISDSTNNSSVTPFGNYNTIRVHYYTYTGTTTSIRERFTGVVPATGVCETNITVPKTLNGNNILNETGAMSGCVTGGWDRQQTYDNKKNPFCFFAIQLPSLEVYEQYLWIVPANNITLEKSTSMFLHTTYSYTYRSNGLPSVVKALDVQNGTYNYKGIYYYRN